MAEGSVLMRVVEVDYFPKTPTDDFAPDDLVVRVVGRDEFDERRVVYVSGCRPHCYVPAGTPLGPTDRTDDYQVLAAQTGFETAMDSEAVKRIEVAHPKHVNAIEKLDGVEWTTEADIPFYRRVTWDYGLSGYIRVPDARNVDVREIETAIAPESVDPIDPRVCIMDIEVVADEAKSFDEMKERARDPIVANTLYDTYDDAYEVLVVDPDDRVDPQAVKARLADHWGDHDLADRYVGADITLTRVASEADLLNASIGFVQRRRPDLAVGWNFTDFDWEYFLARCESYPDAADDGEADVVDHSKLSDVGSVFTNGYGVETAVAGLPAFDQMRAFCDKMSFSEWRSQALEYVASKEVGIGKVGGVSVAKAYDDDRSKLAAYNLLDVQLCAAITAQNDIETFFLDLADLAAIQIYDTLSEKRIVDGYIGSRRGPDQVLPNQEERDVVDPAGGMVLTPFDGTADLVAAFDLKSLYPSSMISCNISPDTMVADPMEVSVDTPLATVPGMPVREADYGGRVTADDINWDHSPGRSHALNVQRFRLDRQGILPEFVAKLFAEREKFKRKRDQYDPDDRLYDVYDRKQAAVKVIMNSFYGVSNSGYFRFARDGVGDAITSVSRYVLWRAAEFMREMGYEVIYGDTDSVFVRLDYKDRGVEAALKDARGLANHLNDHMDAVAEDLGLPAHNEWAAQVDHGTDRHCWHFEFEKLYARYLQVGKKKRYAGHVVWKGGKHVDDLDVTGFESQRADVPEITAEVQRGVLRRILDDCGFSEVSGYVRDQIERVRAADDLDQIGVPIGFSQPLADYGNIPRARAARFSNDHLGKAYAPGDDPWMYYVRRTPAGVPHTDVLALEWYEDIPEGYELDGPKTVEKAFESALSPILEAAGWTFNEVREGRQNEPAADAAATDYVGDPWASDDTPTATDDPDDPDDDPDDDPGGAAAW